MVRFMKLFVILAAETFTLLQGLALSSIGDYKRAEEAHMKAIQLDRNFLEAWAHLTQVPRSHIYSIRLFLSVMKVF